MLVYGKSEYFVMQMFYACVLCVSCGSSQCCIVHDLQWVGSSDQGLEGWCYVCESCQSGLSV